MFARKNAGSSARFSAFGPQARAERRLRRWLVTIAAPSLLCVGIQYARGSVILSGYNFGASSDGSEATFAATTVDPSVNAGSLTRGSGSPGVAAGGDGENNGTGDVFNAHNGFSQASLAAAISSNDYFQWTLTPVDGSVVSLTTLNYDVYAQNNGTSPGGFSGTVEYSLDGFATNDGVYVGSFSGVTPQDNPYLANPETADLSSIAALQGLTSSETVTFRFYGYNGAGYTDQGFGKASGDDLYILGTSAVPEPASLGLMSLAAIGLLRRRARRA